MTRYEHRQYGGMPIVLIGVGAAVLLIVGVLTALGPAAILGAALLVLVLLVFSSLNIEVTRTHLHWQFGFGLFSKAVPLADISDCEVTRTRLWEGLGVHLTPRGWLYNVAGRGAVAIRLKSGKRFLLGTDEPAQLRAALIGTTARAR